MNSSKRWHLLYRGPLSSCNYGCIYCPFAKTSNTAAELRDDEEKLNRFVDWVAEQTDREIGILFTPWGEAVIHPYYQRAITRLSHLANVYRVAIQTNLSGKLAWLHDCDKETAALWTTFHPTQTSLPDFLTRCAELDEIGARYSVGVVGFTDQLGLFQDLRRKLKPDVYLWANAYKDAENYYTESDIEAFESLDPNFRTNTVRHPSRGLPCNAGHSKFSIDGNGDTYRCHFIKTKIGNIFEADFRSIISPTPAACTNETCGCHIGYVHLPSLNQSKVYKDGLLERIPAP
jgi:MoaA/NifB/PqqE/SkfB family radical SAM enzyme